ncbi:hypothetical protein L7F22_032780 [Adiantum nelumboides]|nr:hypothetical protein [Adiantum nelumboides]
MRTSSHRHEEQVDSLDAHGESSCMVVEMADLEADDALVVQSFLDACTSEQSSELVVQESMLHKHSRAGVLIESTAQSRKKTRRLQAMYTCVPHLLLSLPGCRHTASHGVSDPAEVGSLLAMKDGFGDVLNRLANWVGDDPCGAARWKGVYCTSIGGTQFVHELRLMNMNFTGVLMAHIGNLTHLSILNLMWNKLQGSIPPKIGKLKNLSLLLFDGNELSGTLPPELGNLSKLDRLQIDSNNLSGPLPPSFQRLSNIRHM